MKFKLNLACILLLAFTAHAQNEADVFRYSNQPMSGTARFMGLGGAMGALGGDISAFAINPAGIGIYRFNDVTFTPTFEINDLSTLSGNHPTSTGQNRLVINNAGFVLHNELKHPDWKALNFGMSYNRLNTYNDRLTVLSTNEISQSLMQDFVNEADGNIPAELDPFSSLLAYNTFVIDTISSTGYAGIVHSGQMNLSQTATRKGRHSETNLTFGSNYKDVLYLGLSMGIQGIRYSSKIVTSETPTDLLSTDLITYQFTENLEIQGTGFNAKFGAIVKAGKIFRFGGSIQTPTSILLTDTYQNTISTSSRITDEILDDDSGIGDFEYRIRTPWRYMLSVAGIIGKTALVSVQYELVNFSNGEIKTARSSDGNIFNQTNDLIATYGSAQNTIRAGIEFRFNESFYGRGGFAHFSNAVPVNESYGGNQDRQQYSAGIGYRMPGWNIDISYQFARVDEPYLTNQSADVIILENTLHAIGITFGIRL